MIIGISIPWYDIVCSYSTAINVIPENVLDTFNKTNYTRTILHACKLNN